MSSDVNLVPPWRTGCIQTDPSQAYGCYKTVMVFVVDHGPVVQGCVDEGERRKQVEEGSLHPRV